MSTFGSIFRVTTYGESHCASVGAIIDGVPPVRTCDLFEPNPWLIQLIGLGTLRTWYSDTTQSPQTRSEQSHHSRRFGFLWSIYAQTHYGLKRDEKDLVHLQSGIEHGVTLGTPIGLLVKNEDHRPKDYSETDLYPRPSHADWTYLEKYGVKASSGGGRSSARETIGESYLDSFFCNHHLIIYVQDEWQPVQLQKSTLNSHTESRSSLLCLPLVKFTYLPPLHLHLSFPSMGMRRTMMCQMHSHPSLGSYLQLWPGKRLTRNQPGVLMLRLLNVWPRYAPCFRPINLSSNGSIAHHPRKRCPRLDRWHGHLRRPKCPIGSRWTRLRPLGSQTSSCDAVYPCNKSLRDWIWIPWNRSSRIQT